LFMRASDTTKYLIYDDILNNEPMVAKYQAFGQAQIDASGGADSICDRIVSSVEYGPPSVVSGVWYEECGPGMHMRLQSLDTDGAGIDNSIGFVWRSTNNNGCPYDDSVGGINHCGNPNLEKHWGIPEFYQQNFGGSALLIFVR
ncbi:MAG: hypothetical protein GXO48_06045, partial [Chlorobi bacterium]|nr:hypothetical protein [Chlorobiota bacterium]